MESTSHASPNPTLPIILLIEQREDLNVPSPQMLHVVSQPRLAVRHGRERHECLATGPLQAVLPNHHCRLAQRVAWQLQRRKEGGNVLFGCLCVRREIGAHGIGQSTQLEREDVVLFDAMDQHGLFLRIRPRQLTHQQVALARLLGGPSRLQSPEGGVQWIAQ